LAGGQHVGPADGLAQQVQRPVNTGNANLDSCLYYLGRMDSLKALRNYILAYRANPAAERTLAELGFNYVNTSHKFEEAVVLYNMLLKINTGEPHYYFYRGVAYYSTGKVKEAKADWLVAVKMNSNEVKQSASNNLAVIYEGEGDYNQALYYAELSKSLGYNVDPAYIAKLRQKKEVKK
jgi:Flp pilus assembly protein TadD